VAEVTDNLAAALAAFQLELPHLGKDNTARIEGKEGKAGYAYKYADLADVSKLVLPLLAKYGLSFSAKPTIEDGRFVLVYTLRHTGGDSDGGVYPLPANATPQQTGSAISYARRYALQAMTGVAADEDDDGKAAQETKVDATAREFAWDPIHQGTLRDGWEAEIQDAKTPADLDGISQRLMAARKPEADDRISPATYDHLKIAGAAKRAELNGAKQEVKPDAGQLGTVPAQ